MSDETKPAQPAAAAVPAAAAPKPAAAAGPAKVTIEDFKKLEFRVGKVLSVANHPNADRLYVLEVDLGTEKRQIVAGVKAFYTPEQLTGQHVIIVANLAPAQLRGVESQGMMLAATTADSVAVLTPDPRKPSLPGQKVS
ncbi:MAG: methionine--tRNA ligase subunit beta [Candidatus Brocadiae bacterium]|nr:methionine--tRNA ligase subunit beta [Candidatus Brocadiia bacterium]